MLGKIKKSDIYFGDIVYYNNNFKGNIDDVVACQGSRSFVLDQEHTLLIKVGDYYINITSIRGYLEYLRIRNNSDFDNSVYKCLCVDTNIMHRLLLSGQTLSDVYLIRKDNIIPYDDAIIEYYGVQPKDSEYLSFSECKRVSHRCTKEHDGMDDIVKEYMLANKKR